MSVVMLVSADKEIERLLTEALAGTGARIAPRCASAREAAEMFSQGIFSLAVIDMFLPESSGLETLRQLKRIHDKGAFLLLTRVRTRSILERAFRLGAQDTLFYPVDGETLRDTILHRLRGEQLA